MPLTCTNRDINPATAYNTVATTVGVIMETLKHFGIGIGIFAVITALVFGFEYITIDILNMSKENVGTTLMVLALLIIAKPFGELSVSVYNNTFNKK